MINSSFILSWFFFLIFFPSDVATAMQNNYILLGHASLNGSIVVTSPYLQHKLLSLVPLLQPIHIWRLVSTHEFHLIF